MWWQLANETDVRWTDHVPDGKRGQHQVQYQCEERLRADSTAGGIWTYERNAFPLLRDIAAAGIPAVSGQTTEVLPTACLTASPPPAPERARPGW